MKMTIKRSIGYFTACLVALLLAPFVCKAEVNPLSMESRELARSLASFSSVGVAHYLSSSLNPKDLFFSSFKYACLFFLLALLVLYFCKKFGCFKRENPLWDKLTYLYYLYIPVVLVAFGAVYGALSSGETQAVATIRNNIAPSANRFLIKAIGDFLPEANKLLGSTTPEQAAQVLRDHFEKGIDNSIRSGVGNLNAVWEKLPDSARSFVVDICVAVLVDKLAEYAGTNRGEVMQGWNIVKRAPFLDLIHKGGDLFGDYAAKKVGSVIRTYRIVAEVFLFLALLVPVADVMIARRKWAASPAPAAEEAPRASD
ncbi:MAG: hypothetical protein LBM17_05120 [Candidatus Accumulibacter sp.]|jgi:hypothetical protein|nr:hypothetical protein [Accumulibacter sp.]